VIARTKDKAGLSGPHRLPADDYLLGRGEIEKLPDDTRNPLRKDTDQGLTPGRKRGAEVVFVPSRGSYKKDTIRGRCLVIL